MLPCRQTRGSGQLSVAPCENASSLLLDNESHPQFVVRVVKVVLPLLPLTKTC